MTFAAARAFFAAAPQYSMLRVQREIVKRVLAAEPARAGTRPAVLIGKDTRISGYLLEAALRSLGRVLGVLSVRDLMGSLIERHKRLLRRLHDEPATLLFPYPSSY